MPSSSEAVSGFSSSALTCLSQHLRTCLAIHYHQLLCCRITNPPYVCGLSYTRMEFGAGKILLLNMTQMFCMWVNMVLLRLWGFLGNKSSRSGKILQEWEW